MFRGAKKGSTTERHLLAINIKQKVNKNNVFITRIVH